MRRNQRYSQEEMYAAIERCHTESISYSSYCRETSIHYATFKYWIGKYDREKSGATVQAKQASFLPVKVDSPVSLQANITITYPNGIRIECPCNMPTEQLATLLKQQ